MKREKKSQAKLAQLIKDALKVHPGCEDVEVIFTHNERGPAMSGANWNARVQAREPGRPNVIKTDCMMHGGEIVRTLQASYDLED
jgi:hypothetical protein